jgi:hypothetical protein
VIVVDDGSTDGTAAAVAPYRDRIRYVRRDNCGQSAARNHGIEIGSSAYVAFMDADDYYLPGGLTALRDGLAARPEIGALQGGIVEVDAGGMRIRERPLWDECATFDLESCVRRKPVALKSMMLRREWAERVGGFDTTLRWAEDVDFLIRLVAAGCAVEWLRRFVTCYRLHDSNITRDAVGEAVAIEAVLDKYFARSDVPPDLRAKQRIILFYSRTWAAWRIFRAGQTDALPTQIRHALAAAPHDLVATALEWQQRAREWTRREGQSAAELASFTAHLEAALGERVGSEAAWRQLRWWSLVWEPVLQNEPEEARAGLVALEPADVENLTGMAQASLLATDADDMMSAVDRLWAAYERSGNVPAHARGAVTSLYLTVFGQALLARKPRIAATALSAAIRRTTNRRAMRAWPAFLRAAATHFSRRPA